MTTTLMRTIRERPKCFQEIREQVADDVLLKFALEAVQAVEPSKLKAAVLEIDQHRPQLMLTLLSYCYAAGIYGSRDIQWATRHHPSVRYICANNLPHWQAIRHFRRHNRELVEQGLAHVLRQLAQLALLQDGETSEHLGSGVSHEDFLCQAREKIEIAMIFDIAESD